MQKFLAGFLVLFAAALSAHGQATLRVGDPIEMKLSGVPNDEQIQFNNTYTVDATGAVNLRRTAKLGCDAHHRRIEQVASIQIAKQRGVGLIEHR